MGSKEKFQAESSVIETKKFLENLIYDGKKRFFVRRCDAHIVRQSLPLLKNHPQPSAKLPKIL